MPRRPSAGPVTSPYGPRKLNVPGVGPFHYGEDSVGEGNVAPEDGTIVFAGYAGVFGNVILVRSKKTPDVVWNLAHHAHLNGRRVGQQVAEGEHLAPQGMTGLATGIHVHAERRVGGGNYPQSGTHTDPARYYTAPATGAPAGGGGPPFNPDTLTEEDMPAVLYRAEGHPSVLALGSKFWTVTATEAKSAIAGGVREVWLTKKTLAELITDARRSKTPGAGPLIVRRPANTVFIGHGGAVVLANHEEVANLKKAGVPEVTVSNPLSELMIRDVRSGTNS